MRAWIEISSEYRFRKKLSGENGLYAPSMTRYVNMLRRIQRGDVVLHYITKSDAMSKSSESSIVGISLADSYMIENGTRLTLDLSNTAELSIPVNIKELKKMKTKSERLLSLISQSFQRYIAEIELCDVDDIMRIHPENEKLIKEMSAYRVLFRAADSFL